MDDLRAVMDAVGSERATLFGHSEGGAMCVLFAATYPESDRRLDPDRRSCRPAAQRPLPMGSDAGGADGRHRGARADLG